MKRFILVLFSLIVAATVFAGGGRQSQGAAGRVEEVFLFSSVGAYQRLLEQEVQKWNEGEGASIGVRIRMETNIDTYGPVLQSMLQAGTVPDLFDTYADLEIIAAGYTKNLYEVPELADLVERFKPYLVQGINFHGNNLVALPLEILPMKMVYNKEIFAKAGIAAPPKTWTELVDIAKRITDAGKGEFYGFGWTTLWTYSFRRLGMEANVHNTGASFFNTNNGTYDFRPFKPAIEAVAQMYRDGSLFPTPMDQHIDPIRNRFAEGRVGMEVAPAYDISVYNTQFPCNFDWGVFDVPTFQPGAAPYKGMALNRANVSISSRVSSQRMAAVAAAFRFLHSEYLYGKLYANSAIIPHEPGIIASTRMENALRNWDVMSDTTNFLPALPDPTNLLNLEGDDMHVTFERIMLGRSTFDAEVDALNRRYNEAYQRAKAQGVVDSRIFEFPFSFR